MKHLIEPKDLTDQEVDGILDLADRIIADPKTYAHKCDGKKLATLFYERIALKNYYRGAKVEVEVVDGERIEHRK